MPAADQCRTAGLLLQAYRDCGEEKLFVRFHELLFASLSREVRGLGGGRIDPDEAASLALTSIFLSSGAYRYRGGAAFQAWLRAVLRNTVRKVRRSSLRHRSLEGVPEPADRGAGDPARLFVLREEKLVLFRAYGLIAWLCWQMVERLEHKERALLVRHCCEGATFREISSSLGIAEPRIAGAVRRARERVCRFVLQTLSRWH